MIPGIPDKKRITPLPHFDKPQAWDYVIHEHHADRAGLHYDLRLVDPATGIAHSWAIRNLPESPGQKSLAVRQPDHTREYTKFQGVLTDGYGKGTVKIYKSGVAEVLKSDGTHFRFNFYDGTRTTRYSLIATGGNNWLFFNHTSTEENKPYIPRSKPSYKSIAPEAVEYNNPNQVVAPKIDGAANIFDLRGRKGIDVYSYRPSKKSQELIDHTYRLRANEVALPHDLKNTVLMGEVYARDPQGRALPPQDTTGALVSNVWKSRNKVPDFGVALYDVIRYKGTPYNDRPYRDKLPILQDIARQVPYLTTPPLAFTPEEKRRLLSQVSFKQHPLTEEGFVVYDLDKSVPTKAKFKEDHDIYVRRILPGEGQNANRMGRIEYSYTPNGPIIGNVGGGFSNELRQDMWDNPKKYIGRVMRVYSIGKTANGALKVPQFKDFRDAELFPKLAEYDNHLLKTLGVAAASTGMGLIPGRGPEAALAYKLAPEGAKAQASAKTLTYALAGSTAPIVFGASKIIKNPKAFVRTVQKLKKDKKLWRNTKTLLGKYYINTAIASGLGGGLGYHKGVKNNELQ